MAEEHQTDPDDELDADEVKGRAKEAAGALTGDDQLENEGRVDRAVSDTKRGVDRVAEKVKGLLRSGK